MIKSRLTFPTIALAVIAAACSSGGSNTTASTSATATPASSTEASETTPGARRIEMVDCDSAPEQVVIVCEAYELIQIHYVDQIDDAVLAAAAIQGLEALDGTTSSDPLTCAVPTDEFSASCEVAASTADDSSQAAEAIVIGLATHALDPNSTYFDQEALELLEDEQEGQIEGIGALVSPEDQTIEGDNKQCTVVSETCRILIVATIEGAPAEAAGLQRDDAIIGVNGMSVEGWTIDEVTSQVRGPAGTDVVLTIDRDGETLEVSITRAAVIIPVIDSERFGNVGYIRLRIFSSNADEQFEDAVVDLLIEGIDELVIDLRNNPGGLLDTAVDIASIFLLDGDVVVTQGPDERSAYPVTGAAIVPKGMKVTFIVNKGSASASEVVSAVLQERGLVTVVGENTFGKNTVQQRFKLSNGGALKLTIARWLTPGGLDFGGVGVTPDVEMTFEPGIETADLVEAVVAAT
ncbi:MAG: S41 family peptidase [Acidobacteria bacterium]|nr:S41 family peptidase [Acidobacteriota bacterium]TDI52778.1 MAG: S41 family peptidase [Acidobacteriota bacterium]TDI55100.1 MAG: S41 family peptidase [Acidobacteriota bacterium]